MTREERFKMDMIDEFKLMCEIVGRSGRIIANKHRMLKVLEQKPRKSHWIIDGHHRRCPECGEYFCINDAEGNEIPSSYCPNCGTDMREVQ